MKRLLGKGKARNGKSLFIFIPSADTHAFVQHCFSSDYNDFNGRMTYFSAALPPPPSLMHSESVIMCLHSVCSTVALAMAVVTQSVI